MDADISAVRQGDWKLIVFRKDGNSELFNPATDPYEKNDLASQESERVSELKALLGMIVNEKEALEHGAVTQFCRLYADDRLGQIEFCSLLNPPKPDALCKKDGEDLFIEVGHIYGTDSDAKKRLGRTGQSAPTEEEQHESRMMPSRILPRLNNLLKSKSAKTYEGSPVWLLVRNLHPALDKSDFLRDSDNIVVPENHSFEEIWLLCCPYIGGLLRLYIGQAHARTCRQRK